MQDKNLLTPEEVEYFKNNQHEITQELLDALRSQGKLGRHQALEILDMPKNEKMFYVDAYGAPVSYEGNKGLKKAGTQFGLSKIHESEIERCASDFNYFRENYILIRTPSGIDFPDVRPYQDRMISALLQDEREEVVGLMGRQCVSGDTVLDFEDRDRSIKELFENPEI